MGRECTASLNAACRSFLAVVVTVAVAPTVVSAGAVRCPEGRPMLPLVPGASWVYRGTIESTVLKRGSAHLIRRLVTRTMEVRAVKRYGRTTVALVKGYPGELAWYEPGRPRGTYLIIQPEGGAFYLVADDDGSALQRWRATCRAPPIPDPAHMMLDRFLRVGRTFGGDKSVKKRPDKWYQWHVEAARCVQIPGVPGVDAKRRRHEYRIGFRTCPGHVLLYFVPGLGITRYVYSHHGTVAETDVRLIEFRRGLQGTVPSASTSRPRLRLPTRPSAERRGAPTTWSAASLPYASSSAITGSPAVIAPGRSSSVRAWRPR
jgi:hypothetical protein